MSSPTLNQTEFALIADTLSPSISKESSDRGRDASALLTARAIVAVGILGAGFWFALWRVAVYLWLSR